jgi:hypothetical protein
MGLAAHVEKFMNLSHEMPEVQTHGVTPLMAPSPSVLMHHDRRAEPGSIHLTRSRGRG